MVSTPATRESPSEIIAPGDDTAAQLARIWQAELGVDVVAPDQNFFDLGGDFPPAVRMFAQVEKIFGIKLPLATLYEASTIADLTVILRGEWFARIAGPHVPPGRRKSIDTRKLLV